MKTYITVSRRLAILVVSLITASLGRQAFGCNQAFSYLLPNPGDMVYTAVSGTNSWATSGVWLASTSGSFNSAGAWVVTSGSYASPPTGAVVVIPVGSQINLSSSLATNLSKIIVQGILNLHSTATVSINVETLLVDGTNGHSDGTTGQLLLGTGTNAGATGSITIINTGSDIDTSADPYKMSRGIISRGTVSITGQYKTPYVALAGDANIGDNTLTLSASPVGWEVGDQIVVAATDFEMVSGTVPGYGLQNEVRTIQSIGAGGLTLGISQLTYKHARPYNNPLYQVHVANLTRNVWIQSAAMDSDPIYERGHFLTMVGSCTLQNALFLRMGRTYKRAIVTDPTLDPESCLMVSGSENPRARYAVHFHHAGPLTTDTMGTVSGCVVRDAVGWGFVNHDSSVNMDSNVCFDFGGAGFVSEDGSERGSFTNNFALGGIGNNQFPETTTVYANLPRMENGDMGFTGDGFWFQGPGLTVTGNIAAGCKGNGFMYWCVGKYDPLYVSGTDTPGQIMGFPISRIPSNVSASPWTYNPSNEVLSGSLALAGDIPVQSFSNNVAYACFIGLKFRFVNMTVNQPIQESTTDGRLVNQIGKTMVTGTATPWAGAGLISDCTFWNNLDGVHATYAQALTFQNLTIAWDPLKGLGGMGVDLHAIVKNLVFSGTTTIQNYNTGIIWTNTTSNVSNPPVFSGSMQYPGVSQPQLVLTGTEDYANLAIGWKNPSEQTGNGKIPEPTPTPTYYYSGADSGDDQ